MARKARENLHLFGIRHHGPGSAQSLVAALDALNPVRVLIEGPPDADALIPFAAQESLRPPVALLVYGEDDPANASFFPFAVYSPEWQAMRWALARGVPVRFIDLPVANRLALEAAAREDQQARGERPGKEGPVETPEIAAMRRDPLGWFAHIAGYSDSETWWNALIEQNANPPAIFSALETAMLALREQAEAHSWLPDKERQREELREAHMRLALDAACREAEGAPVAVICGAWHVPALRKEREPGEDKAQLKGLPRIKVAATWVPWTETRLAKASGYGAGVSSPAWYAHLWEESARSLEMDKEDGERINESAARWFVRAAALLRRKGHAASTASVIEAVRLATALASLRGLARPGLDETQEACAAALLHGETAPWRLVEAELVTGQGVGQVGEDVPQMPLAADLARWQKKLKLKPEALDQEISLDLRSEAGLAKSLLLHRLNLLQVTWGTLLDAGGSRGTFRENWRLRWEPELSVRLAEALIHGTTLEQAAGNAALATARGAPSLAKSAQSVQGCLLAGLDGAAQEAIALLQARAAATSDIAALAAAVPPIATVLRYGTARRMPEAELRLLVRSLAEAVCAGLVHACRNLQREEATALKGKFAALNEAFVVLDEKALNEDWQRALNWTADDGNAHPLLRGFAVRTLYDRGVFAGGQAAGYLSRALSRSLPPAEAGDWLHGFLGEAGHILLHDAELRRLISRWLMEVDEESFLTLLPLLRRAFSTLDSTGRRRLLDEVLKDRLSADSADEGGRYATVSAPAASPVEKLYTPGFAEALPLLFTLLGLEKESLPQ